MKAYFFNGGLYVRYDAETDRVDEGFPLPIGEHWAGLSDAGFATGVDGAVNWGNAKAYFFRRDQYLRYDIAADRTDSGFPLPIAGNWPGFAEAGFATGIDAAENWGNGKAYFFRGDAYLRYDIASDTVDDGYPLPVAGNWPGLAEAGAAAPDAAVLWSPGPQDGAGAPT